LAHNQQPMACLDVEVEGHVVHGTLRNFGVEKRKGTPYGTRSYLLGGTTWEKARREEAGCPPVFPSGKSARNMLLI